MVQKERDCENTYEFISVWMGLLLDDLIGKNDMFSNDHSCE